MLTNAVIAFAIAALGGLVLASHVLRGRLAPWAISLIHAAVGAVGLVFLILAVIGGAAGAATVALVILLIAAIGGFYLASLHLKKVVAPKPVVLVHAGAAVVGFLTLVAVVFGMA